MRTKRRQLQGKCRSARSGQQAPPPDTVQVHAKTGPNGRTAGLVRRMLLAALLLCAAWPVAAQQSRQPKGRRIVSSDPDRYRGDRRTVRGGLLHASDSTARRGEPADSLGRIAAEVLDSLGATIDSLGATNAIPDSLRSAIDPDDSAIRRIIPDSLRTIIPDSLPTAAGAAPEENRGAEPDRKRRGFLSDSMSLSRVCWISTVLPGYGQIYNKQYWKLPVLYTTFGTSLALFIHENGKYRPLKRRFDEITNLDMNRTEELEQVQNAMIRHNTKRQIFLATTVASYIYFIGDAAVNYSTNEVSDIKKATTLSTICPAAGQIYNKSYWKVPIVIGGFASMIYCIDWNSRGYQRFKKAYRLRYEYDQKVEAHNRDPENNPLPEGSTDEFRGRYSAEFLKNLKNSYRRNRDLCIIATAGIYLLQIIDAHVDAHLKDFDISDDLAVRIAPTVDYAYIADTGNRPVFGFNFSLNF